MKKKELQGVKEIARRANVAIATVDRVIHNRGGVSEKTREKILAIIQELDYQPNLLARRLASGKSNRLVALIPSATPELDFWDAPRRGIQRADAEVRAYGLRVDELFFDLNDKQTFVEQTRLILANPPDGVVLAPMFVEEARAFALACGERGIPYVFIDSNIPDLPSLSYIGPPLFESGYLAGRLSTYALRGAGRVLVVNLAADLESFTYRRIEEGFRAYLTEHRPACLVDRIDLHETDQTAVSTALSAYLTAHPDLDLIFVTNSRTFLVARFLESSSLPTKPMLIGYDLVQKNSQYLQQGTIDFLICHQPEDQGYRSIMALYQHLVFQTPVEAVHYMPIDIVTRENSLFYEN